MKSKRDWIHVVDLARGHIAALEKLEKNLGIKVYNLGAGRGFSVKEAVEAFENVSGIKLKVLLNAFVLFIWIIWKSHWMKT